MQERGRESVFFEARLRRFEIWRAAVGIVALGAVTASSAWAVSSLAAVDGSRALVIAGLAALLALGTLWLAAALWRTERGLLACRDGAWSFASEVAPVRTGALEVALDLGSFLLLRLGDRRRTAIWLPVQRLGLESEWHALRCAVYSPPPTARATPGHSASLPE